MSRDYEKVQKTDAEDVKKMAFAISSPLHFSTKTPSCKDPMNCHMCFNAARLGVQWYRPELSRNGLLIRLWMRMTSAVK